MNENLDIADLMILHAWLIKLRGRAIVRQDGAFAAYSNAAYHVEQELLIRAPEIEQLAQEMRLPGTTVH